jgi:hypothetical protein
MRNNSFLVLIPSIFLNFSRVAIAQEAHDLQFTTTGVVDSQYYSEGKLTDHLTNEFTCFVSKGNYSMFLTASDPKNKRTISFECLFDGTNTYFTRRLSSNLVTAVSIIKDGQIFEKQLSKPLPPNNNAILQISKGSMPPSEEQAVTLVWLALGSIADSGEVLAPNQAPVTYLGKVYQDQHLKLKANAKAHESIPNFLEWREDYHEGNIFTEEHGKLQKTPILGQLSIGYTNSSYNVVSWTNLMGLSFPEYAQLKIFLPSEDKTRVECLIICAIVTSSIQIGIPDTSFSPVVVAKTMVHERRMESDSAKAAPYYLSMDGGLLSPAQLANGPPRYKVSPLQIDKVEKTLLTKRHLFLAIFILLFLSPLALLAVFKWKQSAKETN